MAVPDSMFLFEISVEQLKSYINCREFCITSQFADIFNINLKDPNELGLLLPKGPRHFKSKRKTQVRYGKANSERHPRVSKVQTGQSILFANNIETLIANMKQYPMELCLWSKIVPDYKIGSTNIPWSASYIEYLNKLHKKQEPPPVCVTGDYNVFDEFTSKRMAVIKLNIKLSYLKDKVTTQFRSITGKNPQTLMYTGLNSKPHSILSTIKDRPINLAEETGTIKTIYSSGKRKTRKFGRDKNKNNKKETKVISNPCNQKLISRCEISKVDDKSEDGRRFNPDIVNLIKSEVNIKKTQMAIKKSKSCSVIGHEHHNMLNYIFGASSGPFGSRVYCVSYFTVENDFQDSPKSAGSPKSGGPSDSAGSPKSEGPPNSAGSPKSADSPKPVASKSTDESEKSDKSDEVKLRERYKFRVCDRKCVGKKADTDHMQSVCSLDLPQDAAHLISVGKCDRVECHHKPLRELPSPPDDRILLDLESFNKECCKKVEEVAGGMKARLLFTEDPCYCECECTFGFTKKTTYCNICGGYEIPGDEHAEKPAYDMPFPCPIYHKLADKSKMKALSATGSDTKRKDKEKEKETTKPRSSQVEKVVEKKNVEKKIVEKKTAEKKTAEKKIVEKSIEPEKDLPKKGKKKKKDDRFKFNYGYTAPHIGHSRCGMPCTGTMAVVPKHMGWLWTAENVPGIKYRPSWKPGAANKHIVRMLKIAKNPGEILSKKRKKDLGKGKRPLKRPLLVVHKKEGEYTVTMETMKTYTKPRTFNQYPYEDKPLVTYTIGRTEEENRQRKKKKERAKRRLERDQREFIQSAFSDMCKEICLKTYQQALGILPDAEKPDCACYPAKPEFTHGDGDMSCSCSEDSISESDTDSDEWIVEFTPPNATFDPAYKCKKMILADATTQYSYMDYRVKLLDRYGNPVPRFFKTPDGKQHCSDLGGFWGPNHKWLEINTDGFIGPDEKWAPNVFTGPSGEQVDAETGKFQDMDGKWLVVGVDGYVDVQGKWKFYPKPKPVPEKKRHSGPAKKGAGEHKEEAGVKPSEATWSCFGTASPKHLSKMGIIGHGHDRKLLLSTLQDMLAHGEDVKIPQPSTVPHIAINKEKGKRRTYGARTKDSRMHYFSDRRKCKHATPSDKGIVAVDGHGNKTYFRLKGINNKRPKERIATLTHQGISLSSFHVPCFHSFISSELMKKQKYERLLALSKGATANHKCTNTTSVHSHPTQDMYSYRN